jgi:hypothetical protein
LKLQQNLPGITQKITQRLPAFSFVISQKENPGLLSGRHSLPLFPKETVRRDLHPASFPWFSAGGCPLVPTYYRKKVPRFPSLRSHIPTPPSPQGGAVIFKSSEGSWPGGRRGPPDSVPCGPGPENNLPMKTFRLDPNFGEEGNLPSGFLLLHRPSAGRKPSGKYTSFVRERPRTILRWIPHIDR